MQYQSFRVLVVESNQKRRDNLKESLLREDFRVETVDNLNATQKIISILSFDAVIINLELNDTASLSFIPLISSSLPFAKIIVITEFGTIDLAVDALESGAAAVISEPNNTSRIVSELKKRLDLVFEENEIEILELAAQLGIIGKSPAICRVIEQVKQLAMIDATVLITGESGTGKEAIARSVHMLSNRHSESFEAINCGAIPENLLESELFGYKRGAFTDAKTNKKGTFEICSNGTIFLDEIGEMPTSLQVKLLRVLQEKEVRPIGSTQSIKIQTRVVAATNKDLNVEIENKKFREDLYFRVSVFPIWLPPLRERTEDIPLLVSHFLQLFNTRYGRSVKFPSKELMARLMSYSWPGNIRELQNSIERGVVLTKNENLDIANIFIKKTNHSNSNNEFQSLNYTDAKLSFEKSYLKKILHASDGNISEAARIAGRFRSDIYRLMEKHGLKQPNDKSNL